MATHCIFCSKVLVGGDVIRKPSLDSLRVIFRTCEVRTDSLLLSIRDDIISGRQLIAYHKVCRASYTSKTNLKYVTKQSTASLTNEESPSIGDTSKMSRKDTLSFNIRMDCFICGKSRKKCEKLSAISTGTGNITRSRVLLAAQIRNDRTVALRMEHHTDLFAFDAKYHRSCYAAYISDRNMKAAKRKYEDTGLDNQLSHTFNYVKSNILDQRQATTLADLTGIASSHLPNAGGDHVQSWKLKTKLKQHFHDDIMFVHRPGKSDIVCSGSVSVGDALTSLSVLQAQKDDEDVALISVVADQQENDRTILHKAASILR